MVMRIVALFVTLVFSVACQRIDEQADQNPSLPGKWVERDGSRICDGYLTRNTGEDSCASEVPTDWRPFVFDGKIYYLQPLSDDSEAQ